MRIFFHARAAAFLAGGMFSASAMAAIVTGPSSSQSPYVRPTAPGVDATSLLTVGDAVQGYAMVGIPDGLGAMQAHYPTTPSLVEGGQLYVFSTNGAIPEPAAATLVAMALVAMTGATRRR